MGTKENITGSLSTPATFGSASPRMVLYLPHKPNAFDTLVKHPSVSTLLENNSNHWRKIVTLLAKICSPNADDWRRFRDSALFDDAAISISPSLSLDDGKIWHWIGGKENLQRFTGLTLNADPLPDCKEVAIDQERRLLITPYPDYRQLSNTVVSTIRAALDSYGFYRRL